MARKRIPAPSFSPAGLFAPAMLWADLALKSSEMLLASGQVIGTRVHRMARAGAQPSARDRKEFVRMGSEKLQAAGESAWAVAARMQSAQFQSAPRGFGAWGAWASLGQAALAPYHGASTANARRLARPATRR
ncbi:hypothetical protein [uncultured Ramlibacter sp.]|uniref:hypothetical protein n=1 Tax=uncultured Ramlibacter sp. TaxID=260755 RepID=UPI0026257AB2|nr:hypothetical protein [uncultured Ramlibacter sp.]